MAYAVFASGGGEAIDLAIKSARRATGRRRVVSVAGAYHGHTGLALAAGDREAAEAFLSTGADDEFPQVPFNDLPALEAALAAAPTAAVILETIPATIGFPIPDAGLPRRRPRALRPVRRAVHRRRGADRAGPDRVRCGRCSAPTSPPTSS